MLKTVLITILSGFVGLLFSPFAGAVIVMCWIHGWITSWRLSKLGLEKMQGMDAFMSQYDMIITSIFFLSGFPNTTQINLGWEQIVQARDHSGHLRYAKFSKVMEKHNGLWFWVTAAKVHFNNHIHLHKGTAPSNETELKIILRALQNAPLRTDIPPWQIILLPLQGEFATSGLHCCLVYRFHHAIGDGYTFFKFLHSHSGCNRTVYEPKNTLGNVKEPSKLQQLFMFSYAMSVLFRMWFEGRRTERNLLHGPQLNNKDYITWAMFDFKAVKAIKDASKTTLNDVILSCLTGAIRKFASAKTAAIPHSFSCMVPMATYKPNNNYTLENSILLLRLRLPIHLEEPCERLKATKTALDELKRSPDIVAEKLAVKFILPYFPRQLLDWFVVNTNAMTIGTSSFAGPNEPFIIFGQRVVQSYPIQPHHGLLGINITFYGQLDKLHVALNADSAIIKNQQDLDMIIAYIVEELQELHQKVLPGPAPQIKL